ncbi:unnamed protein product [Phytophthora fragariaefolia]|uniref:Unnamed protein product n=1 Tax=Phytophthora fragariaefolia TaxID=1490495 RepID=A0A9W6Y276_9STRA|nr:unnamed protein product [Phytophthora fragariaefolia]
MGTVKNNWLAVVENNLKKVKGIAHARIAENSLAGQSSAFTVEESADKTIAPVREVLSVRAPVREILSVRAEGGDAVQSVAHEDVEIRRSPSATGLFHGGDEKMEEAETTFHCDADEVQFLLTTDSHQVVDLRWQKYAELNVNDGTLFDLHDKIGLVRLAFILGGR